MVDYITLNNLKLKVEYSYDAPYSGSEFEPPEPEDVEVYAVWIDEYDIFHLIGENTLDKIYAELYKIIDENKGERND